MMASPAVAERLDVGLPGLGDQQHDHGTTPNDCSVRFDLSYNNNAAYVTVSRIGYDDRTGPQSSPPDNVHDLRWYVEIYVDRINDSYDKVLVDIAVPSSSIDGTPDACARGTRLSCEIPGHRGAGRGHGDSSPSPSRTTIMTTGHLHARLLPAARAGPAVHLGQHGIYKLFVSAHAVEDRRPRGAGRSGATGVGEKKITAKVDSQPIDVFVYITSVNQSADVSYDVSSKIASIGDKITYSLKIKNLQPQENIYRLSASGLPANWYARFKSDASSQEDLAEVVLAPNAERNLVIEIVPPYSVSAGDYNFTASITTPEGSTISKDLMLRLKSSVSMDMLVGKLGYDAKPGEAFNIDVSVQNTGNGAALTNVYLETKAPDGWTVQVTPNKTASLTAGKYQVFRVTVTPPGNIVPSDYDVTITAKCDQAEKEKDFRITVTVDSWVPYIGGGIILVVVVGLLLVYRKYGRR